MDWRIVVLTIPRRAERETPHLVRDRDGRQRMRRPRCLFKLTFAPVIQCRWRIPPGRSGESASVAALRRDVSLSGQISMADFSPRTYRLSLIPVQMYQRQLQPVVDQLAADQVYHHRRGVNRRGQRQAGNRAQMQFNRLMLAPFCVQCPLLCTRGASSLINRPSGVIKTFHRHYADIVQRLHNC